MGQKTESFSKVVFATIAFHITLGILALLGLPESFAAVIVIIFVAFLFLANPYNAIPFFILSAPFFLGESGWPYYPLFELAVVISMLAAFLSTTVKKIKFSLPFAKILLLVFVASAFSLPLDSKELMHDLWVIPTDTFYAAFLSADNRIKISYFRFLYNLATGIFFLGLTHSFCKEYGFRPFAKLFAGASLLTIVVVLSSLYMGSDLYEAPEPARFLTLSLVGSWSFALTGFSYAAHFFNQWLLLILPMVMIAAVSGLEEKNKITISLSLAAFLLVIAALLMGGIRSSLLILLLLFLGGAIWLFARFTKNIERRKRVVTATSVGVALFAIIAVTLPQTKAYERFDRVIVEPISNANFDDIDSIISDPLYFEKKGVSEPRIYLWSTAIKMLVSSPLLGVGYGQFSAQFLDYFPRELYNQRRHAGMVGATSHSFYFETLANQGILGFVAWSLLLTSIFLLGYKAICVSEENRDKVVIGFGLVAITIWLLIGLIHYTPLCRAVDTLFWIQLGIVTGPASRLVELREPSTKTIKVWGAVLVAALIVQLGLIYSKPIDSGYENGFYHWEEKENGALARWMGHRAVMAIEPNGKDVVIPFWAPLPGLDKRPQKVTFTLDGQRQQLSINDNKRKEIRFENVSAGAQVLRIETEYVYNPHLENGSSDNRDLGIMIGKRIFSNEAYQRVR